MSLQKLVVRQDRGPFLRLISSHNHYKGERSQIISKEHQIADLAVVRFKYDHNDSVLATSVSAKKLGTAKDFFVEITVCFKILHNSSQQLQVHTDEWIEWKSLGNYSHKQVNSKDGVLLYMMQVDIVARKVVKSQNIHAKVYDDDTFIDFHLTASDGSVGVHKVFLAAHSDVFSRMLQGKWKETAEGCVELEGLTRQTLQHLKDYLYLGALPDEGLRPLLLLAKYFLIDDLKVECTRKLVNTVKADNLHSLLDFACEHNVPELVFGILHLTPDETVNAAYKKNKTKRLL